MPDHIEPNLDAYLAGGLSADERRELEQHCEACSACAQQLTEGKQVDQLMNNLFAQTRPDAGLEHRTLERLRRKPAKRYGIMYFVYAAAAMIALGLIGAAVQAMLEGSFGGVRMAQADAEVRNLNGILDNADSMSRYKPELATLSKIGASVNERFSAIDGDPAVAQFNTDIQFMNERIAKTAAPEATTPSVEFAMPDLSSFSGRVPESLKGKRNEMAGNLGEPTKRWKAVDKFGFMTPTGGDAVTLSDERKPSHRSSQGFSDLDGSVTGIYSSGKPTPTPFVGAGAPPDPTPAPTKIEPSPTDMQNYSAFAPGYYFGITAKTPPAPVANNPQALGEKKPSADSGVRFGYQSTDLGLDTNKSTEYFRLAPLGNQNPAKTTPQFGGSDWKRLEAIAALQQEARKPGFDPKTKANVAKHLENLLEEERQQKNTGKVAKKGKPSPEPGVPDPTVQPLPDANRKIIRTGEMEFEIDSFYASVDTISGLLKKATKGTGFIATSNSDKLPNGKMKGSVVVRMPPQHLDDFLVQLRTALGKVGELKSQHIGSADVTKQYTDIESELRAARAVETRLIEIIKTGKGEIKDLVAAERELGSWRTKIEKMEGEIRYYNNQVSLSTVTITLTEKEIQAAVALVMRERVLMNVEVEEVEKAQDSIAAGVKAAKGRIVKNDLNVGDAGQVSAIVHVDVPPDAAPLFRELLKKLGVVSKYQADRTQQAVGGSADKLTELKTRTDDVRFEINLYNTANIKPRETRHFKLGVADVEQTYRTIRDAVTKMKGQIRKANLNEQDRLNVTADLVFNVAATDRAAVDKLIAAAGFIVSKHTVQAAINETATERTVGYEISLRNIAAIPPRDIFTIALASLDVPASYRKLRDAVEQFKGRIHKGQLNVQDKFNVSAEFDFDVASADKAAVDTLIGEIGVAIARKNEQFPAKDESTDQKVGYRLTLKNAAGMTPREKAMLALRVNDVDARAAQLKELVTASKGRVVFSKSERNKNGETKMVLIFELPHAALEPIIRQIKDGQTPLVYDKELNPQVPDNDLATAQIALTLIAGPDIVPSEGEGLGAMLHTGLSKAMYVFLFCLVVVISGLAFIVPWALPIWGVVWLVRRNRAPKTAETPKVG